MCVVCIIGLVVVAFLHGTANSDLTLIAIHLVVILRVVLTNQLVPWCRLEAPQKLTISNLSSSTESSPPTMPFVFRQGDLPMLDLQVDRVLILRYDNPNGRVRNSKSQFPYHCGVFMVVFHC